jgi:hypothetical protein
MNREEQAPQTEAAVKKPSAAKAHARAEKSAKRAGNARPKRQRKTSSARRVTKTAKILALLGRPEGASLAELKRATGWQAHSVRGFLSGAVRKQMGLRVAFAQREDGARAYRIPSK